MMPVFLGMMLAQPTHIEASGPGVDLKRIGDLISVTMADPDDTLQYAGNHLTLTFDLTTYENVVLAFEARESGDEPHPLRDLQGSTREDGEGVFGPVADFNFDGVAIGGDGDNWYEARGLRDLSSRRFAAIEIDLDATIANAGLFYAENFRVRFCQYDNMPRRMDGITIHGIQLTGEPLEVDPSLVLHLPMDDNAPNPTVRDRTRKHHQTFLDPGGDPNTAAHSVEGPSGAASRALAFDGLDDRIRIDPALIDLASPFTVSFWFNANSTQGQYYFGRDGGSSSPGLVIYVYPDRRMLASLTDDNGVNAYAVASDTYDFNGFAHVAVTRGETDLNLYVNGNLLESQNAGALGPIRPEVLNIAVYSGVHAACAIDDFRIHDRELDAAEIRSLYSGMA